MTTVRAFGPVGALMALSNLDIELHGVRQRSFRSGKIVSNGQGYGETTTARYYVNGKRCSRNAALSVLSKFIGEREELVIEGSLK